MSDFWSIAIGVSIAVVACSLAYGIGAFIAWLTQPRHDASDEHADALFIGEGWGGDYIHNGQDR